ncbi:MAG: methylmalonyl-CoA mutase, partial [Ilumatobacteraceae bacterium]|nr:methylmalonyl-CoA mutase [Ilumatobacteraceae bacterium]
FGAKKESSKLLRFHTQTGGSTLTAQQPENNVVRVAIQSMAAVMGGTQSLHTNSYDEALSLPSQQAAQVALRTQQIIGYESGIVDTPDPMAGSYFVETLTNEVERLAWEYLDRIDEMGGAVEGIEAGFQQSEIDQAAYDYAKSIDDNERIIVGLNKFAVATDGDPAVFPVDPELERGQKATLSEFKSTRDLALVDARLADVTAAATGTQNLLDPMKEALRARATLGEVSDALRAVFGVYRPG